ncbi:MAG: hypothetical protein D8M58_21740 [Calditrichaeota bacterium]|nr:MAG: hypothetical protein DWQ03_00735 [Calditrichota bacterium]MBL1208038.1 hypothetical protein [Calditrichota bacterium]NOG47873.1 hypothetical protein [Calditrichota bacterium]
MYSFFISEGQEITIDLQEECWGERWALYGDLVAPLAAPNKIPEDAIDEETIVKLIEIYDKELLRIYDKNVWLKSRKEMEKLYSSLERNLETKVNKMTQKSPLTPEHQKEIEQFKKDIMERKKKYNAKLWADPLYIWIFNLYNLLLLHTPKMEEHDTYQFDPNPGIHGERLFNTRLQKYIDGRSKASYRQLAKEKDKLLLDALEHVDNPQMSIDNSRTKDFIAEFLCNFESCYSDLISTSRFFFDEDDEGARKSKSKAVQRIIFNTHAENSKEKLLKELGVGYDTEKKKYFYK